MATETVVGLLVALVVPVWLVVEQVLKWKVLVSWGAPDSKRDRTAAEKLPATPAGSRLAPAARAAAAPTVSSRAA